MTGWDWLTKLSELVDSDQKVAIVTVARVTGSAPRETGAKMLVTEDGRFFGTVGGGNLELQAIEEAKRCLAEEASRVVRYPLGAMVGQCCGGVVELLFECAATGPRLYLYGAGHVGQAVCRVMEDTGFRVHLIDERDEWCDAPGLPKSVVRHLEGWETFNEHAGWDERDTYAVVMTHRHDLDQEIVASLLRRPLRYLGLIGSKGKWARFQDRLLGRGFTATELARVKCPIGLSDLGKAPKEIAISLAAELLSLHHSHFDAGHHSSSTPL